MSLLVIDTACEACTAAVLTDGGAAVIESEIVGRGHAEALFGMIEAALRRAGHDLSRLDRIAVNVGPGSFTGVRVGVATARGLALVLGKPLAAVTTLAVHADLAAAIGPAGRPILALLEGRGGQAFGQAFTEAGEPIGPPALRAWRNWAAEAEKLGAALAGSGAASVAASAAAGPPILHGRSAPDPEALLRVAARTPAGDEPVRPLYLKAPDATPRPGGAP